jgi:hypothetical protein
MTDRIKRLEETWAGSRELDREMAIATGVLLTGIREDGVWGVKEGRWTQSLDAAVALAERVYPNGWLDLDIRPGRTSHARQCFEGNRAHHAEHASPIIAACIAILKATDTGRE